jgi:hypothetical protein
MSTLDRRQTEAQAEWNECLLLVSLGPRFHDDLREQSSEGGAIYSVAFGFLLGRGLSADRAHEVASHPETEL